MKVGGVITCIKDYELNAHVFHKGEKYKILSSPNNFIDDKTGEYYKLIFVNGIYFYLCLEYSLPISSKSNSPYFYDYFLNIREERKLKLKKLNGQILDS